MVILMLLLSTGGDSSTNGDSNVTSGDSSGNNHTDYSNMNDAFSTNAYAMYIILVFACRTDTD